jgi:hypothetical protein
MSALQEENVQYVINSPYYHFCLREAKYDSNDLVTELSYTRIKIVLERAVVDGRRVFQAKCERCGKTFRLIRL